MSADLPFEAFFLPGLAGPLFAIYHRPSDQGDKGFDLVFVPPFAEEMNRSRTMVTRQARALGRIGVGVLVLDLYGTGESGGDFRDARWETWLADVLAAAAWLEQRGRRRIGLWGLRLGALLAIECACQDPDRFQHVILWHPVASGTQFLKQFLRIQVAATMGQSEKGESTDRLRTVLLANGAIEVAGYELNSALAVALEAARLDALAPPSSIRIDWLELVSAPDQSLAPASGRVLDRWRGSGGRVVAQTVVGEPFWSLPEITLAPALIRATNCLFETPAT